MSAASSAPSATNDAETAHVQPVTLDFAIGYDTESDAISSSDSNLDLFDSESTLSLDDAEISLQTFVVQFQRHEIKSFMPVNPCSSNSRLLGDWTEFMYKQFITVWPTCCLVFKQNYFLRRNDGNNVQWKGNAMCTISDCIKVSFAMNIGNTDEVVNLIIAVHGVCTHADGGSKDDIPRKRKLTGARRQAVSESLKKSGQSAHETYLQLLNRMGLEECKAGNYTSCQSPQVFRQAVSELRLKAQLHSDTIQEIRIVHDVLKIAIQHDKVPGFIQTVGAEPFMVGMFRAEQIQFYITQCKSENGATLHFDATGSIIAKSTVAGSRPLYLYSLVCANVSTTLPVFEFLTNKHNVTTISGQLLNFNDAVRAISGGVTVRPRIIVTDFSFPLILSTLLVFNSKSLKKYLQFTFDVVRGQVSESEA